MNTAKLIIMLVLVLLVGIFAGSLGTRIYLRHEIERSDAHRTNPEERINMIVGRLTGELKLDERQQAEVRKIIARTDARATGIKATYEPQLKKVFDLSFRRIGETLTGEQKARLETRQKKLSAKFNATYFRSMRYALAEPPDIEIIARSLKLDSTQRSEVDAILKQERERQGLIIEKYQKIDNPDLMEVSRDISEVRNASMKDLSKVLTNEQLAKFKEDGAVY